MIVAALNGPVASFGAETKAVLEVIGLKPQAAGGAEIIERPRRCHGALMTGR